MFLKRSEYERLMMLAAQSDFLKTALAAAQKRAEDAENALASERGSKDWLTVQLASRVVTKHGQYGLDHEKPEAVVPKEHPKGFLRDPTEMDMAQLEWLKQCAAQAGVPEEDAIMKWEAYMRGEGIPIESEVEQ